MEIAAACPQCGHAIGASALGCGNCGWLRHSAELAQLAQQGNAAMEAGDLASAREYWLRAAELMPEDSPQYRSMRAGIGDLSRQIEAAETAGHAGWKRKAGAAGSAGIILLSSADINIPPGAKSKYLWISHFFQQLLEKFKSLGYEFYLCLCIN